MIRDDQGRQPADEFIELIARRFATLAQPMRIKLLDALHGSGEASVGELAAILDTRHGNASKHLNVLYAEGIVGRRKDGTRLVYRVVDETALALCDMVSGGVRDRLRELGDLLQAGQPSATTER